MPRLLILLYGFLLLPNPLWAQEPYPLDTLYPVHDLEPRLLVLADPEGRLQADEVVSDSSLAFTPRAELPRLLDHKTIYWGKLRIQAKAAVRDWQLHLEELFLNSPAWIRGNGKVDVYAYANEQLLFHKKTGANYPDSVRDQPGDWQRNRVSVSFPEGAPITLLVRVEGNSFGFYPFFRLSLRKPGFDNYHPYLPLHASFDIFMLGVTFIIFLYHFLQWLYLRQKVFFWFSLWVFLCTCTQAMAVGLDTEYLLAEYPELRFPLWMVIPNSMLFTFWFFGRAFINSGERFPKLDKYMLALPALMILELLASLGLILFDGPVAQTRVGYHYEFVALFSALGLGLAIAITLKKDRLAKYFGIGAIFATISVLVGVLWSSGYIRLSFVPYTWGILLQVIAYSFGIAYRQQRLNLQAQAEKLEAAESRAEAQRVRDLDEVKTRFFANISHEFRTPLTLISGPLAQAKKDAEQEGQSRMGPVRLSEKAFNTIQKNTQRLQSLIDQLLDLSRLESGKQSLALSRGGLIGYLRQLVFSFESLAERRNISLNANFPTEPEGAVYDRDKLHKIIVNLLSNAFKYTPEGGAVTVLASHDNRYLTLEIQDTGKGIGKEAISRVFERFYRVEGTEEKGSGIGLALTKELVDLHHGQISVTSSEGQGSMFKLRLPFTLQDLPKDLTLPETDPAKAATAVTAVQGSDDMAELHSPNQQEAERPVALLVEDNPDLSGFLADLLDGQYEVLRAADGLQGERMAYEHIPDIVVTDVMMPKKDGYALCHSLRRNVKTSHIPIIMLTAKAGQANKMEGLTQGADAYLTKPFDSGELLLRMNNLIGGRKRLWDYFKSVEGVVLDDLEITSLDDRFLQDVLKVIRENLDNELLSVSDIGRGVGFSRSQLHRKLKALTNKSANQLIVEVRLSEARRLLEHRAGSVSEIAYSVGYSNLSYFTKSFKEKFGILPSKVRAL